MGELVNHIGVGQCSKSGGDSDREGLAANKWMRRHGHRGCWVRELGVEALEGIHQCGVEVITIVGEAGKVFEGMISKEVHAQMKLKREVEWTSHFS